MSELGDLLELMYTATSRYTTLRVTIREWQHLERTERAFQRYAEALDAPGGRGAMVMVGFGFGTEPPPKTTETLIRIWTAPQAKTRMERSGDGEPQTTVSDGEQVWTFAPSLGAYVNPAQGMYHGFEHLADPSLLLGQLVLEPASATSVAGRDAILVRATSRGREGLGFPGLAEGAERHELAVDTERGILLRVVSYFDGEEFTSYEVLDVAFDETFPDDTFVFSPPPGEEVRDIDSTFPMPEHVTIEEAARRAPFTTLLPRRLPEGATLELFYNPGSDRPPMPVSVTLAYRFESAGHSLAIAQTGGPEPVGADEGWERLERDGQVMRIRDEYGQRLVVLERYGTHVMVTSDLDRDTLVEIAYSLEPAPSEPPRLVDA
jgi:outer membrane lipoprotein-sorting protein